MTVWNGTEDHAPELRPLTGDERNTLDMLISLYNDSMLTLDSDKVVEHAKAVAQVEGLLTRIKITGLVAPVLSTVERV